MRSSSVLSLAGAVVLGGLEAVVAQTPLVYKRFPYADIPYKADTYVRTRTCTWASERTCDGAVDRLHGLDHTPVCRSMLTSI